jgi:hypothetical protein
MSASLELDISNLPIEVYDHFPGRTSQMRSPYLTSYRGSDEPTLNISVSVVSLSPKWPYAKRSISTCPFIDFGVQRG